MEPTIEVNSLWSPITNGKPTSGYPSVGKLSGCTATLVGPKTVAAASGQPGQSGAARRLQRRQGSW